MRPLILLIHEAELCAQRRQTMSKELLFLFNSLFAAQTESHLSDWEKVIRRAEILGNLLHKLNGMIGIALRRKGHTQQTIEAYQEALLETTTAEKLFELLTSLSKDLRRQKRTAA